MSNLPLPLLSPAGAPGDVIQVLTPQGQLGLILQPYSSPPNTGNGTKPNSINAAPIGPGDPVHFDSQTITKQRSGLVYVDGSITGTMDAQNIVSISLLRDGTTPLVGPIQVAPGGIGAFPFSGELSWIDTLPDDLPHFYRIQVSSAGATEELVPAGGADFQLIEL